jgi:hypothetical protein
MAAKPEVISHVLYEEGYIIPTAKSLFYGIAKLVELKIDTLPGRFTLEVYKMVVTPDVIPLETEFQQPYLSNRGHL